MIFHDITLLANGTQSSRRQHDSRMLVREAVAVFAEMLREHGDAFRVPIPHPAFGHIELHWTQERPGAALATFLARGQLATTSLLLSGSNPEGEVQCWKAAQRMIVQVFRTTAIEPGFDLAGIVERPAIVTIPWPNPNASRDDLMVIADMETCIAASYFEVST